MMRSSALFAAVLLAGTCLATNAQAGLFDWSSKSKAAQASAAKDAVIKADAAKAADDAKPASAALDKDMLLARQMRVAGDLDGATRSLAQMMLVFPDDPRVVGEYGKVLAQRGRSQDAVNFLTRATDLQPGDWTLYSALGMAYDQTGDAVKARMAYERALQIKPGDPVILNNYALSRAGAGDLEGAQRMLAQAAATPNADPKIARNIAMVASLKTTAPVAVASVPVARPLPANTVMQKLPADPKAGAVTAKTDPASATRAPRELAAGAKPKAPVKKKDATPSLRMTADASAP